MRKTKRRLSNEKELDAKFKRGAHDFLMETRGYLGVVYREQVKRVNRLKARLDKLEEK